MQKNQELQWDVARLNKEIESKNQEIDKYRQGRGLRMHDVWCGADQERWLHFDFIRYAPEWTLHGFLRAITLILVQQNLSTDAHFQAACQEIWANRRREARQAKCNVQPTRGPQFQRKSH